MGGDPSPPMLKSVEAALTKGGRGGWMETKFEYPIIEQPLRGPSFRLFLSLSYLGKVSGNFNHKFSELWIV